MSTDGSNYVWTEREQIDPDQVCPSCNQVNPKDTIHCESCETFLLEDETTSDPKEFSDSVEQSLAHSKQDVYRSLESKMDRTVYNGYHRFKRSMFALETILQYVLTLAFMMYVPMYLFEHSSFPDFTVALGAILGVVGFVLLYGDDIADYE